MITLPTPTLEEQEFSQQLSHLIQVKINQEGPLPFHEFMASALYSPQLGYYMRHQPMGKKGDFVTAPELSPLFGQTIAEYILTSFRAHLPKVIWEFGAGSGRLVTDILLHLERHQALPKSYGIIELSPYLKAVQYETLSRYCPHLLERVQWWDTLPPQLDGFILANELLDALPVDLFIYQDKKFWERRVAFKEDGFYFENHPASGALTQALSPYASEWEDGYCGEYPLTLLPWFETLAERCQNSEWLLIDYGYEANELYHQTRRRGSLRCYYQQLAHANPFWWPGLQDITAHVNFSLLMTIAKVLGFRIKKWQNQADFLIEQGLLTLAPTDLPVEGLYQQGQALKQLLLPSEMGHIFKVLGLTKTLTPQVSAL